MLFINVTIIRLSTSTCIGGGKCVGALGGGGGGGGGGRGGGGRRPQPSPLSGALAGCSPKCVRPCLF